MTTTDSASGQPNKFSSIVGMNLRKLELCSNKIANCGLKLLIKHFHEHLMNRSKLKHLSLYDNDLSGTDATNLIIDMVSKHLRDLEFLSLQGNLIY